MQTKDKTLIQCHECGQLRKRLNNSHLRTHGINAERYKQRNGIALTTPLAATIWIQKKSANIKADPRAYYKRARLRTSDYVRRSKRPVSIEERNQFGTCGAQLAYRLASYIKETRKLPSGKSGSSGRQLYRSIDNHLGSLKRALKYFFGVKYKTSGRMITLVKGRSRIKYDAERDNEKAHQWLVKNIPALKLPKTKLGKYLSAMALREYNSHV